MPVFSQTLIQRLDQLNQKRIARSLELMDAASQQVFQQIPVLLHYNHPLVPAYYNSDVPVGIRQFQPNSNQQQFIDNLSTTLGTPLPPALNPMILGLYTMGSTATFGQNDKSDLDIWVCVAPSMNRKDRTALTEKCLLITDWAQTYGVEANFFLMDSGRFRTNQSEEMTGDNCGSSQHMLLLDEFYRSAVRLAGQRLLWQIVPPDMDPIYDSYVRELVTQQHIQLDEWIDFGPLTSIPAEEYFGSNLWQLYKSIDSPYKSVLKAILLEAYSWEYPKTQLLSIERKRYFYGLDPLEYNEESNGTDAYLIMMDKVTQYLESIDDHARLDLVRRCFYLKTREKLSRQAMGLVKKTWRSETLLEMTQAWGWDTDVLTELDSRREWKVEQVKKVHHVLLDALMQSYRNLIQFARRNDITSAISPQDISILARKLYAAFEELPGKVTLLNPKISPDLSESELSFIEVRSQGVNAQGWYLYKQPLIPSALLGKKPLEYHPYLSRLVAWAFFNGLITESTQLYSVIRAANIDTDKFYQMVSDLRNTFSLRKRRPSMQALASPCEINQLAMFINFENDPTAEMSSRDLKFELKDVDVLSFGKQQRNIIGSVDLVYRNSWREVRTMHFVGETAILDAIKAILNKMHQDAIPPDSVDVFSYAKGVSGVIRNSIYQLLMECIKLRLKPVKKGSRRRFKGVRLGGEMYGLFFERRGVSVQKLEDSVEFYRSISTNKLKGSPLLMLDREQQFHLPEVTDGFASEGLIQFFFEDTDDGFNIYVLDEMNRVEAYHQFTGTKDEMIHDVNHFYTTVHNENNGESGAINFNLPQYYQIVHPYDDLQGIAQDAYVIPYRNDNSTPNKSSKVIR